MFSAKTKLCLVIGDPIEHSLSPLIHNAGYRALGIDDRFVFLAARVKLKGVKKAMEAIRTLGIRGVSCTMPHKAKVMKYLDKIDKAAEEIGAVNTIVNQRGLLKGYNTDWLGALKPIEKRARIREKKIGIIGAGGASRAIVYGLKKRGGRIKIFNKNFQQAADLAKKWKCEFSGFDALEELKDFDIIINATPLGMKPYEKISPVSKDVFSKKQLVMDVVYQPYLTRMLKEAKKKGAEVVSGAEMLLYQAFYQFEYYTRRKPPKQAMRRALMAFYR